MEATCRIHKPGFLTMVQDAGRYGYQKDGIITSGVMDLYSFYMANILLGNNRDAAVLESSLIGPTIQFVKETVIAITGAKTIPLLNNKPVSMWSTVKVQNGDILSFHPLTKGTTLYIAFLGGIDVPEVLSSRSTLLPANLGGFSGRELRKGDFLYTQNQDNQLKWKRKLHVSIIPIMENEVDIRVILGPELDRFSGESVQQFFESTYEVTLQSNRMGYRLNGPALLHKNGADIYSEAVTFGTIQIPADGFPIILMADRQTTGGYTRLATVISVDLPKLAQLGPHSKIRFQELDVHQAEELYKERERLFRKLEYSLTCI